MISINVTSVFVNDQRQALTFYTNVRGFILKHDISLSCANDPDSGARWLAVVPVADPDGVELLLEPNSHPAAAAYQG